MPVYEYKCEKCGCEFEAKQGMDDEPLAECKECSGPVHRLISFTSFTLKGGGWYSDGYAAGSSVKKNGKKPKTNGNNGKAKSKDATGSSTSSTTTLGKDK
jgi:putative FmdB family regulatory protein